MATIGGLYISIGTKLGPLRAGILAAERRLFRFSDTAKRVSGSVRGSFSAIISKTNALRVAIGGALSALGAGVTAAPFVQAASTAEQLRLRLTALLGSVEQGNRLFQDMARFAGQVPFEYEDIMQSATALAGVMKGGVDEINQWMPMIADLAAVSGLSIRDTTDQIIRMYSAGAASADLFRERGILAMLGFQAGVSYSAEETRKKLMEIYPTASWRNATQDLANTWSGTLSMLSDKWFQFRTMIMDSGPFEYIKLLARTFDEYIAEALDQSRYDMLDWGETIVASIGNVIRALAYFREFLRFIQIAYTGIMAIFNALSGAAWWLVQQIARAIRALLNGVSVALTATLDGINALIDMLPDDIAEKFRIEDTRVTISTEAIRSVEDYAAAWKSIEWQDMQTRIDETMERIGQIGSTIRDTEILLESLDLELQSILQEKMIRGEVPGYGVLTIKPRVDTSNIKTGTTQVQEDLLRIVSVGEAMQQAFQNAGSAFQRTLVDRIMEGKWSWDAFADAVLRGLVEMAVRLTIVNTLFMALNTLMRVMGIAGGAPTPAPAPTASVPAMASGGIVKQPTLALIGEAGPEAVIPLSRMRDIGGNSVIVNVINQSVATTEVRQVRKPNGMREIRVLIRDAVKDMISRGELNAELRAVYGLQRVPR